MEQRRLDGNRDLMTPVMGSDHPAQVIRDYLEGHGGSVEVHVDEIARAWRVEGLGDQDRARISAALASAGVETDPPLLEADDHARVRVSLARPAPSATSESAAELLPEAPPGERAPSPPAPSVAPRGGLARRLLNPVLGRRRRSKPPPSRGHVSRHLRRLFPFVRPHWKLAVALFSVIGFAVLAGLAAPWPLAFVIDTVIGDKPVPPVLQPVLGGLGTYALLAVAAAGGLVLTALAHGLAVVDDYVGTKLNVRLILDLRSALYRHLQKLSLGFHDHVPTGQIMFRLTQQANAIGLIVLAFPPLAQSLLAVVGMFTIAVFIDWQLALISIAVLPLLVYSARYYANRVEPRVYEVRNLEARSQSIMYETVSMIRVILAFGRERDEHRRWRAQAELANNARVRLTLSQTLFSLAVATITAAGTALVLGLGALNVLRGRLTVGELVVLLGYIAAIYKPLEQATATFTQLQQQFINFEGALDLLDTPQDIEDAPDAVAVGTARGQVAFDKVHFEYVSAKGAALPGAERRDSDRAAPPLLAGASSRARQYLEHPELAPVWEKARELGLELDQSISREAALTDVSFEVQPGEHVAIVGPTGAGKTTLVNLMMRFYDPTRGAILLDGLDLRRLKVTSLREQISVVMQEPMLFAGTIVDNIRYAKPDAPHADVVAAAEAANVHDFISGLPEEYETIIGEGGSQLSGGERQRISVARAFLKDAPILVLDEPTSSIDSRTESVVLAALERLMEGRTTFTVAHRLSTVRRADFILVLDHGRLVQQGSHGDLLAERGLYKQLHDAQFGLGPVDAFEASDGAGVETSIPPGFLVFGKLLVAALATLLEEGSDRHLQAVVKNMPKRWRPPTLWSLIGAVLAVLRDDSDIPLRRLSAHREDPRREVRTIAQVAASLLQSRESLRSISERLERAQGTRPQQPLEPELVLREPWTQLTVAAPEAGETLRKVLPTEEAGAAIQPWLKVAPDGNAPEKT